MRSTWIWNLFPVVFLPVGFLGFYLDATAMYFNMFFISICVYLIFFSKSKVFFQLHDIYLANEKVIVKKSFPNRLKTEVPLKNVLRVEYLQHAQQVIGKFWYLDDHNEKENFVYFWPNIREANPITSKLNLLCSKVEISNNERYA